MNKDINDVMLDYLKNLERKKCIETKEPPTTMTLDDFNYYLAVNHKSIATLDENEFIQFKNNFVIAIEKDLSKYYNFVITTCRN